MKMKSELSLLCITIAATSLFIFACKTNVRGDELKVSEIESSTTLYIRGDDEQLLDEYNKRLLQKEYQELTDQKFIDAVKSLKVEEKETKATVRMSVMSVKEEEPENRWNITLTKDEIDLLAKIVWVESRGESDLGQQAVCEIIFNRMKHDDFKGTLEEVLSAKNQFCSWELRNTAKPTKKEYKNIKKVLKGKTDIFTLTYVYFSTRPRNNIGIIKIGNHCFGEF